MGGPSHWAQHLGGARQYVSQCCVRALTFHSHIPQLGLGGIEPRTSPLLVQVFASEPLLSVIRLAVRWSLVLNLCYFGPISGLSGLFKPAPSSLQIAGSLSVFGMFATGNLVCGYPVYLTLACSLDCCSPQPCDPGLKFGLSDFSTPDLGFELRIPYLLQPLTSACSLDYSSVLFLFEHLQFGQFWTPVCF